MDGNAIEIISFSTFYTIPIFFVNGSNHFTEILQRFIVKSGTLVSGESEENNSTEIYIPKILLILLLFNT